MQIKVECVTEIVLRATLFLSLSLDIVAVSDICLFIWFANDFETMQDDVIFVTILMSFYVFEANLAH